MATIKPTLNLTANSFNASSTPGPLTMALSLSATNTISVDDTEHFTSAVRTGIAATGFDKVGYEVGFDRQTLIDGSAAGTLAAKSDGTTLTHTGCWVYMKNTTATTSNHIIAIGHTDDSDAGSGDGLTDLVDANTDTHKDVTERLFSLRAGEWAFFPYDYTGDLYCQATGASQTLEFWRFDRV